MSESCKICKFIDGAEEGYVKRCLRFPPVIKNDWPHVKDHDWCGEWKDGSKDKHE